VRKREFGKQARDALIDDAMTFAGTPAARRRSGETFLPRPVRRSRWRRHNLKHERGIQHVALDETAAVSADRPVDLVALDDALNALARVDSDETVEMRFFG
jgi:hypothetical protein